MPDTLVFVRSTIDDLSTYLFALSLHLISAAHICGRYKCKILHVATQKTTIVILKTHIALHKVHINKHIHDITKSTLKTQHTIYRVTHSHPLKFKINICACYGRKYLAFTKIAYISAYKFLEK